MNQNLWTEVDQYISAKLVPQDPVLETALRHAADSGLPEIQVAPNQGKLLAVLAQAVGSRSILEIGTLGGYSTIWLARALAPGGSLITLEANPKHAEVARENFARAGLSQVIEVRVGPALESLPVLAEEQRPPFDMVFIDADKDNNTLYLEWALKLTRPGSLIIIDNVVRDGRIIEPDNTAGDVQGTRRLYDALAAEPRIFATSLQTVGSKGYDGLVIGVVTGG
jgi:predicted O-methyltransferase YrrM